MSNTASASPVSPERNANQAAPINNEGYNSFDHSRLELYTQRFSEVMPCYFDKCIEGDNTVNQATQDVRTFALQSPLMNNLKMYRSFYAVPLSSIAPKSWEYLLRQPNKGQDIVFGNYDISGKMSDVFAIPRALIQRANALIKSNASAHLQNTAFAMIAYYGSLYFSNNGLFKALGYTAPARQTSVNRVEDNSAIPSSIWDRMYSAFVDMVAAGGYVDLYYTDENGTEYSLLSFTESGTAVVKHTVSEVFNFLSAASFYGTLVIHPRSAQSDKITLYQPLQGLVSQVISEKFPLNWDLTNTRVSLRPLVAYQTIIAQFFSSSTVDSVYNCKAYTDSALSLVSRAYTIAKSRTTSYSENLLPFPYSSKVNGVDVFYDAYSGKYNSYMSDFFIDYITVDPANEYEFIENLQFQKLMCTYVNSLVGIGHSLRFSDYFTSSRTRPLAVGDTTIQVNQNAIQVVDVNKSLWVQRFLNAVNRGRQDIYDYLKQITGIEPPHHMAEPIPLVSEQYNISGMEVENTAEKQGNIVTLMRNSESRYQYKYFAKEPTYIIGVTYFSLLSVYQNATDRTYFMDDRLDWFNSFLQNIGDQPVFARELDSSFSKGGEDYDSKVFGYQQRYAEFKNAVSHARGGFIDGSLPGWSVLYNNSAYKDKYSLVDAAPLVLNSSFLRNFDNVFDPLFASLTGKNQSDRFHFIISTYYNNPYNSKQKKVQNLL